MKKRASNVALIFITISFRTFWSYSTASYGNCFTFNTDLGGISNDSESSTFNWSTSLPGPNHGLSLVLNLEQANICFGQKRTKKSKLELKTEMRTQAEYGRMTQDSGARQVCDNSLLFVLKAYKSNDILIKLS